MIVPPMNPGQLLQKYRPQQPVMIQPQPRPSIDPGWRQNIPQPAQAKNRMAQGLADAIGGMPAPQPKQLGPMMGGYNPQGAAGGEAKRAGGMMSQKGILSAIAGNPAQFRQALRKR